MIHATARSGSRFFPWLALPLTLLLCAVGGLASGRVGEESGPAPTVRPLAPSEQYSLPNGLRVVLAPDAAAPVVAACVTYRVGSRDERPGESGCAHLVEHMMFEGSANVGRGEHRLLVQSVGGAFDGDTGFDTTEFYETVPAGQLPLILFLEADRMGSPDPTQAGLDVQRSVVKAEKRQDEDNQAYADLNNTVLRLAYTSFGYGHPGIGSVADLDRVSVSWVQAFYRNHYAPGNAVLALTGGFDPAAARALIAKDFGPIPARPAAPPPDTSEPRPIGDRRADLSDSFSRLRRCEIAYRIPPVTDPDFPAVTVLANILGSGRTSRLFRALVEPSAALRVSAVARQREGPGLLVITATLPVAMPFGPVEQTVAGVIGQVQRGGVTPDELQKAKNWERVGTLTYLATAVGRARQLSGTTAVEGNAASVDGDLAQIDAVTAAQVRDAARRYLVPSGRVVVTDTPYDRPAGRG